METDKISIKQLIFSVTGIIAVEVVFKIILPARLFHPMITLGITRIVQTAMMLLIISHARGGGLHVSGFRLSRILYGIKRGIIWSLGFGCIVGIGLIILIIFDINPLKLFNLTLPQGIRNLVLLFIVSTILSPIAEETFFRGILYRFARRWNVVISIILNALIFALAHVIVSGAFTVPFIGGILFALSYEREKNLLVPITIHALGNLSLFTISLI
ncbi:MAG: CPBP family intramembrane metalloprotease [Deltaproteobacteria bacterium]|nr:CPBP family intramembrane metalloprotease [Deltaproteobacteria bacterium]